ncbi:hypothetical protein WISP_90626 [Willisornis vidua]|uniref:Uncharacterized protein n=1 Tax=Willisornis vidua TaxID=1566151 RepID=A0ABQ9D7G2_9PASS|nr:hypothetical protein WISP_90626 [Willisornis vidua]
MNTDEPEEMDRDGPEEMDKGGPEEINTDGPVEVNTEEPEEMNRDGPEELSPHTEHWQLPEISPAEGGLGSGTTTPSGLQSPGMVWVGRDLEDHLIPPLAMGRDTSH